MKYVKLFEQFDEFDPFGEEIKEIGDNDIIGYFVCWRSRNDTDEQYAKEYAREERFRLHRNLEDAQEELRKDDYHDDCGSAIYALFKNGDVSVRRRR